LLLGRWLEPVRRQPLLDDVVALDVDDAAPPTSVALLPADQKARTTAVGAERPAVLLGPLGRLSFGELTISGALGEGLSTSAPHAAGPHRPPEYRTRVRLAEM
ncbi:MAG TPA: hypothetical protein VFD47_00460, partial [Actinomycetota bacterium]|nr:hypothetical protein [Actinomycetota bacterium]